MGGWLLYCRPWVLRSVCALVLLKASLVLPNTEEEKKQGFGVL